MREHTTSNYPWLGGYSTWTNRPETYKWTDGTAWDYMNPSWGRNDAHPNYVHYYRNNRWGTWCPSCKSQGICKILNGEGYLGCGKNEGTARVNGHISPMTYEECRAKAISQGKTLFGMEYPQVSSTPGEAQCLLLNSLSEFHAMEKADDSECAHEGMHNGVRLGNAHRLAVYSLNSGESRWMEDSMAAPTKALEELEAPMP